MVVVVVLLVKTRECASLEPWGGPSLQVEPSLQFLSAPHLEDLTNGRRLTPGGAGAGTFMGWGCCQDPSRLGVSQISGLQLPLFCSRDGKDTGIRRTLLRQELKLPGSTDEDIECLCGLTEMLEQYEPPIAMLPLNI